MIRIFTTGGTMDGVGCSGEGCNCKAKAPPTASRVPQLLAEAKSQSEVGVTELFMKNSSKFTDNDREQILSFCVSTCEDQIVITHGTQTMCETARFLADKEVAQGKTIVLTGAMKSTLEDGSDGSFNLGFALAMTLAPGLIPRTLFKTPKGATSSKRRFSSDSLLRRRAQGCSQPSRVRERRRAPGGFESDG